MTIKEKFDEGYDALYLMKNGLLLVGDYGKKVMKARTVGELPFTPGGAASVRKKMEVTYGAMEVTLSTDHTNLVDLAKQHIPSAGDLNEFFNQSSNKLNVYNDNATLFFKLNVQGTWAGSVATTNSMQIEFGNSSYNVVTASKTSNLDADVLQFTTFLSIDKDGAIALGGSEINIRVLEGSFQMDSMLIIIEQWTTDTTINPV